eukprot:m.352180 g.352180  ORF g.352180 m.352180 type:complete len:65 (+) comp16460_c0_seq1:2065-2259(+)
MSSSFPLFSIIINRFFFLFFLMAVRLFSSRQFFVCPVGLGGLKFGAVVLSCPTGTAISVGVPCS